MPTFAPSSRYAQLVAIHQSLLDARGTAYDTSYGTAVWGECLSQARVIFEGWETLRRMSVQRDPDRMTDMLPRWEAILKLAVPFGSSFNARRAVVKRKLQQIAASMTVAGLNQLLAQIYPNIFQAIVRAHSDATPPNAQLAHLPGGLTVPGGVTLTDGAFTSSIYAVLVNVAQPAWMTDSAFYREAKSLYEWVTPVFASHGVIDWFRNASDATESFMLDDEHNLDNQAFGT